MITNTARSIIVIYTTIAIIYLVISTLTVIYATRARNTFQVAQILSKIKSAQPAMIHVMHLGALLLYIYAYMKALVPLSLVVCTIELFLLHSGIILVVGSLILKLYRIWVILNSGFKKVKITDSYMMQLMLLIITTNY